MTRHALAPPPPPKKEITCVKEVQIRIRNVNQILGYQASQKITGKIEGSDPVGSGRSSTGSQSLREQ